MAIAPLPATSRSRIDLRQISREPSLRVSAPATTAAAISPTEWPITAAGSKPCSRHTSASATCIAKIIGWMTSTAASSSPTSTARGVNPISAANISPTLSIVRPNAGSVARRSRPMPTHCDPCPEKTHTGPIARRFAVPSRTPAASLPAAAARRAATSSARSAATTPARWVRWLRRSRRVWATAASGVPAPSVSSQSARFPAAAVRPASVAPDTRNRDGCAVSTRGSVTFGGACSSTTCAIVPP